VDAEVYRTTKLLRGIKASKAFKLQDYHKKYKRFLFIEMINKEGNLCCSMMGMEFMHSRP
jgi:hypothetical protein